MEMTAKAVEKRRFAKAEVKQQVSNDNKHIPLTTFVQIYMVFSGERQQGSQTE